MAKLSVKGLGLASGIIWGLALLLVGLGNQYCSQSYGLAFLQVMDSVYPGYHAAAGLKSVLVGAIYGALDGFVGGALFAWIYNRFAK